MKGTSLDGPSVVERPGFITKDELLLRLPVCKRTLQEWLRRGLIPFIKLPGTRRVLFSWPDVQNALLRNQKGCCYE